MINGRGIFFFGKGILDHYPGLSIELIHVSAAFPATEEFNEFLHFHGSLLRGNNCTGLSPHTLKGGQSSFSV